jgi:methionine-rich copper-binding protein CopC
MTFRRLPAALLLAVAALVTTAAPALAHTSLKSSNPAKGASLAAAPTQIELTFSEAVGLPADPITVEGPDGTAWSVGKASATGAVVTAPVTPTGPAGAYSVKYKVTADDGDTITGTVAFTLTAPATPSTTSPPPSTTPSSRPGTPVASAPPVAAPAPAPAATGTDSDGGGLPGWAWIVIAVGVLAVVALGVVLGGRRGR